MPLYRQNESNFYYVHIPRTAGRFFKELMLSNNLLEKYGDYNKFHCGWEVPHLFYPMYNDLDDVSQVKKITIVRNPVERFKSCAKCLINYHNLSLDFFDDDFTEDRFLRIMDHEMKLKNPFILCQSNFIEKNTLVWKYEDEFGLNFIDWLNSNLDIRIELKPINYTKRPYDNINPQISKKVLNFAKKFYKKDYEMFDYSGD